MLKLYRLLPGKLSHALSLLQRFLCLVCKFVLAHVFLPIRPTVDAS